MEIKQAFPNLLSNIHNENDNTVNIKDNNNTVNNSNNKEKNPNNNIWSTIWNTEVIKEGYGFIPKENSKNPLSWVKRFLVLKKNFFVVYQNKPPSYTVDPSSFLLIDSNLSIELKLEFTINSNSKTKKFPILIMNQLNSKSLIISFVNSRQQKNWYDSMLNLKNKI
ncbi:sesquipedalian [Anaeramoeba flamelloides]|uniref:Sesquipedalian n=1 Tax=Anaeramoeba flamelloides TaxID=1746091 RepID=A0AAV7Z9I2_9EUKA|nr:sesquipedalian [Anaeramoeba flamelloides]